MARYSIRLLKKQELAVFSQYLLPQTYREIRRCAPPWIVLGALWGRFACGAAAVRCSGDTADLASLFVDPQVRGEGIGGALLDQAMALAGEQDCKELAAKYLLAGQELAAMDRLLGCRGKVLTREKPLVYGMDSERYHSHSLLGVAFRYDYQPAASVVPFSSLSAEQLERLEARDEIPSFLRPSVNRARMLPDLSVAWMSDGTATGYLLGSAVGLRDFSLIAAWQERPSTAFLHLLRAQLNLCFYRSGGDFRFFVSPVNPRTERLLLRLTGGAYTRYEKHAAVLPLDGSHSMSSTGRDRDDIT